MEFENALMQPLFAMRSVTEKESSLAAVASASIRSSGSVESTNFNTGSALACKSWLVCFCKFIPMTPVNVLANQY